MESILYSQLYLLKVLKLTPGKQTELSCVTRKTNQKKYPLIMFKEFPPCTAVRLDNVTIKTNLLSLSVHQNVKSTCLECHTIIFLFHPIRSYKRGRCNLADLYEGRQHPSHVNATCVCLRIWGVFYQERVLILKSEKRNQAT